MLWIMLLIWNISVFPLYLFQWIKASPNNWRIIKLLSTDQFYIQIQPFSDSSHAFSYTRRSLIRAKNANDVWHFQYMQTRNNSWVMLEGISCFKICAATSTTQNTVNFINCECSPSWHNQSIRTIQGTFTWKLSRRESPNIRNSLYCYNSDVVYVYGHFWWTRLFRSIPCFSIWI